MTSLTDFVKFSGLQLTSKLSDEKVIAIDKVGIRYITPHANICCTRWFGTETYAKFQQLLDIMDTQLFEKSYDCKVYKLSDGSYLVVDSKHKVTKKERTVETYAIITESEEYTSEWDVYDDGYY